MTNLQTILLFTIFVFSSLTGMSQNKLKIVNSETGEFFELDAPEGLKIYEYNTNFIDSIPYVIEHAQRGEEWAYERTAKGYRYGKGYERSPLNAYAVYEGFLNNGNAMVKEALAENPDDVFGLCASMMENVMSGNMEIVNHTIQRLDAEGFKFHPKALELLNADSLHVAGIFNELPIQDLSAEDLFLCMGKVLTGNKESMDSIVGKYLHTMAAKVPVIYNFVGDMLYDKALAEQDKKILEQAMDLYCKVDSQGLLMQKSARHLRNYYAAFRNNGENPCDDATYTRIHDFGGVNIVRDDEECCQISQMYF